MKHAKRLFSVIVALLVLAFVPVLQMSAKDGTPGSVTGISVKVAETSVKLSWKPTDDATKYRIYLVDKSTGEKQQIGTTAKTSYVVKNLEVGETYAFQVLAANSEGIGSDSQVVVCKTKVMIAAPKNLQITDYDPCSITLSWSAVPNTDGYYVLVYNDKTGVYEVKKETKATTIVMDGLKGRVTYRFKIAPYRLINGKKCTDQRSKVVSGTAKTLNMMTAEVHGRYWQCMVKTTTRVTLLNNNRSYTLKAGTRVVAAALGHKTTKIYFGKNNLSCIVPGRILKRINLSTTLKEYKTDVKENFVNKMGYSSPTSYLIWVSQYTMTINFFYGKQGNWKLVRTGPCVIGDKGHTPPGMFKLLFRDYEYGGPRLWFTYNAARDWGNSFHRRVDSKSRAVASHGCVRLGDADLGFMNTRCPMGTTVVSY